MLRLMISAALCAALAGCGTAPTTATNAESFKRVQDGRYRASEQPLFVDCVFDGFLGAQSMAMATHVRQTKRANGYRIDVIAQAFQYIVADIRDDGTYELRRSKYSEALPFDKEINASEACLKQFAAQ